MNNDFLKLNEILSSYSKGNKNRAYTKLKKISVKYPENQKIKFNLGIMEQDQGLINKAKITYKNLIDKFDNLNAKINLYLLYLKEKNYPNALNIIELILKTDPELNDVLLDKAYILLKSKDIKNCFKICYSILNKNYNNVIAINLIGLCLIEEKNYKEAEIKLLEGIKYKNDDIPLLNSIGKLYFEIWNLKKSEDFYFKALQFNPKSYQTLNNLAGFYLETNRSKKALIYYKKALDILPNEATILSNISKTYLSLSNIEKAEEYCLSALKIRSEDSFKKILSIIYFQKQNFKRAWQYFDGRLGLNDFIEKNKSYKLISKKLLRNKKIDPNKKLLIVREQGVGDEILYGTIYHDLLKNFEQLFIETDKRLISLFINSFGNKYKNKFVELGLFSKNISKLDSFDQVLYAGSLGYYFRNNIESFPKNNYLKISNEDIKHFNTQLKVCKKKYKIGLSWKSFKNQYANQKSLSLNDLDCIISLNNVDSINLQYGDVTQEIAEYNKYSKSKILELKEIDLFNEFIKIGAVLKNIDLFITVSNSTAHLAGALGINTLLIKPFKQATFHYWNQPTNKTPWYNTIELLERDQIKDISFFKDRVLSKLN